MAEALGVAASVIAVIDLAYHSSKSIYELISTIREAPRIYQELNQSIEALNKILLSLRTTLDSRGEDLSEGQVKCLEGAKPVLDGCHHACKDFRGRMNDLASNSQNDGRRFIIGIKLNVHKPVIEKLQTRLACWKGSLSLSLELVLMYGVSVPGNAHFLTIA